MDRFGEYLYGYAEGAAQRPAGMSGPAVVNLISDNEEICVCRKKMSHLVCRLEKIGRVLCLIHAD